MNRVWLKDFLDLYPANQPITNNNLVNIRGCNGSGKSTIPLAMKEEDPDTFELVWHNSGKDRVVATVFPNFKWLALGRYATKCGGMDAMKDTAEIKLAVQTLWVLDYNIIMEGIMASTVRQTYIDLFNELNTTMDQSRDITIYNITTPIEICLQRIQIRNGGKPIKEELVEGKWKTVKNNALKFREAGFRSIEVDNSTFTKDTTLPQFFNILEDKRNG